MEHRSEPLNSLLLFKNNNKIYKAIKILKVGLINPEKTDFILDYIKNHISSYLFDTVSIDGTIYTVIYKEYINRDLLFYHSDISISSYTAIRFFLDTMTIETEENDFKANEILLKTSNTFNSYIEDDFKVFYDKADNDILGSKELALNIKKYISTLDKKWQYIDFVFTYNNKKHFLKIPKLPFIFYSLNVRYSGDSLDMFNIPNWNCISKSGYKCSGDNPYHTDFWVGMGMTIDSAYPHSTFQNEDNFFSTLLSELKDLTFDIQDEYWNFRSNSVGANKSVSGKVIHYDEFKDDFTKVKPDNIIILPHLGVEYELAIFNAIKNGNGGVISEAGGKAAHIAIMGREFDFPIFVEKDALKKYKFIKNVKLDGVNKIISIQPY